MIVTIEKNDLRGAKRFLCSCCVVTKALQRVFESDNVSYSGHYIRIKDKPLCAGQLLAVFNQAVMDIASDFDQNKDVIGRSFEITESNVAKIRSAINAIT